MKTVTVCVLVAVVGCVAAYTDRYDHINVDEVLSSRRMLIPYLKCVLDQAKCTNEGKELKSHIREALEDNCAKCNEKQKENARKVIQHLINKEPDYWNQLVNKYDPQRKFTQRYEKELKKIKN